MNSNSKTETEHEFTKGQLITIRPRGGIDYEAVFLEWENEDKTIAKVLCGDQFESVSSLAIYSFRVG